MRRIQFSLSALISLCAISLLTADQPIVYTPGSLHAWISNLTARGDYYRAITETWRWHFLFNPADEGRLLKRDLGLIYCKAGNWSGGRNKLLDFVTRGKPDRDNEARVKCMIALTYEKENDFRNAFYQMEAVQFPPDSREAYAAKLKRFEYTLKFPVTDAGLLSKEWSGLTNSRTTNAIRCRESYANELSLLKMKMAQAGHLKKKSAFATGLFSVIPGLNQVYFGKYRQGLINFIAHAALIGLTCYEFDREEYVGGSILGLTELSWYIYNFSAGFEQLRLYNEREQRRFQASFSLDMRF